MSEKKKVKFLDRADFQPRFCLGTIIATVICSLLLVMVSFVYSKVNILPFIENTFLENNDIFKTMPVDYTIRNYYYSPFVPIVLFVGAFLGARFCTVAVFLYFLTGLLGYPVFPSGGGLDSLSMQNFGFIIGAFFGVYKLSQLLISKNVNWLSILKATLIAISMIYLWGFFYIAVLVMIKQNSFYSVMQFAIARIFIYFPYDLIIGLIAITVARYLKAFFKPILA